MDFEVEIDDLRKGARAADSAAESAGRVDVARATHRRFRRHVSGEAEAEAEVVLGTEVNTVLGVYGACFQESSG